VVAGCRGRARGRSAGPSVFLRPARRYAALGLAADHPAGPGPPGRPEIKPAARTAKPTFGRSLNHGSTSQARVRVRAPHLCTGRTSASPVAAAASTSSWHNYRRIKPGRSTRKLPGVLLFQRTRLSQLLPESRSFPAFDRGPPVTFRVAGPSFGVIPSSADGPFPPTAGGVPFPPR